MLRDVVIFENLDPEENHELPSPELLDCHYRLCHILHASGMAKSFEYDFNRWEHIKQSIHELREDGKTDVAEILRASFLYDSVPAYPGIPESLSSSK